MARKTTNSGRTNPIPIWVGPYFTQAYDSHERLRQVLQLSRLGLRSMTTHPRLLRAIARVQGQEPDTQQMRNSDQAAASAQAEIDTEFQVLHSLAVVGLWSWLEHAVKGLLIEKLIHEKAAISVPALQRIKVRVSDYVGLTKREQAAYLVELLEQETASPLKRGINRFEVLLEPFGWSGGFEADGSKHLFELQQIRNAVAHQNGRCDRRLKTSCPWLKLKIDSPVAISSTQLADYFAASHEYVLTVLYRVGDSYGKNLRTDPPPQEPLLANDQEDESTTP